MYTILGNIERANYGYNKRWIQFNSDSKDKRPIIVTKSGYKAKNVVAFETADEAKIFIYNFMKSKNRRNFMPIDWSVTEYKGTRSGYNWHHVITPYGKACRKGRAI